VLTQSGSGEGVMNLRKWVRLVIFIFVRSIEPQIRLRETLARHVNADPPSPRVRRDKVMGLGTPGGKGWNRLALAVGEGFASGFGPQIRTDEHRFGEV